MNKNNKPANVRGTNARKTIHNSKKYFSINGCNGLQRKEHWEETKASGLGRFVDHLGKGPIAIKNSDKIRLYYKSAGRIFKITLTGNFTDVNKFLLGNLQFKEIPR